MLTGDVPFVKPLSVTVHQNSTAEHPSHLDAPYALSGPTFIVNTAAITIVAEPWVDVKLVARAYRQEGQLIGGKSGRNRKKKDRTLDGVRFAARQMRNARAVRWSEITRRWNHHYQKDPKRQYVSRGGLQQAFKRFLQPRYNNPQFVFDLEPWQER